jgi:RNA polymerase sigma-70 factor (ECF subfamily)
VSGRYHIAEAAWAGYDPDVAPREHETEMGGANVAFQPTLWTAILKAKDPDSPEHRASLERLLDAYWKPVYFFVRRRGHDVETAKDLTQSFFAAFLEKDFLKDVSREKGRFRSFVLAAVTHFLSNQYDRARAQKRGGGHNFVEAETEIAGSTRTPEQAFADQWALEVMTRATAKLRAETPPEDFALLSGAKPENLKEYDRKNRLHRLRVRLRELLREEIVPTVANEEDAEAELREILSVRTR